MEVKYFQAFLRTLKTFCDQSSIRSLSYLSKDNRPFIERVLWFFLQILLITGAVIMIRGTMINIAEHPVVVTLDNMNYPVENIDFPGISICDINKISKKRFMKLVRVISEKSNISKEHLIKPLQLIGSYYNLHVNDITEHLRVQTLLESYYNSNSSSNSFDVHSLLKSLIRPCKEMLKECYWEGKKWKCSKLFVMRNTFEGFCCTFNYVKKVVGTMYKDNLPLWEKPLKMRKSGSSNGLRIVININADDYFYTLLPTVGVMVHVFNPEDFPDRASGGLIQKLVSPGTETFFSMTPHTFYSTEEVIKYPIEQRKCIFKNEKSTAFGEYSYSDCLVECRMKVTEAICDCLPFYFLLNNSDACTLRDIACLEKFQEKFRTLYPQDANSEELKREAAYSLHCPHCYPSCHSTNYHMFRDEIPLQITEKSKENNDRAILNIFYPKPTSRLYKQDVTFYWFETLSSVGGILGLFIGSSFISILEVVYFFTYQYIRNIFQNRQ